MPSADQIRQKFHETFQQVEKDVIEMCIANGHWNSVSPALMAIGRDIDTPEREHALDDYLNLRKPAPMPEGSPVKKEMEKLEREKGSPLIESPEDEAYWQKRLDDEKKEAESKQKAKVEGVTSDEPQEEVKEEPTEEPKEEKTKKEVMDELKAKGIKFDPSKKKADLAMLLIDSEVDNDVDADEYEA